MTRAARHGASRLAKVFWFFFLKKNSFFFFEKKKQKTFVCLGRVARSHAALA